MRNQFLFASLVVVAGCGAVDPTASGVFPAEGFTGRSLRVEISGDATQWSGTPGVNFGDGVTVSNVTVASPTSLFADITIAADAAPGLHDVTVTNDGTFTLKQAFDLQSPLELSFQGDVAQGGIPYFTINNHDFNTPFDLTQDANSEYSNLLVNAPAGVTLSIQSATSYQLTGYAFIDADAMPGALSIVSGPAMNTTSFNLGANLDVAARTPEPLSGSVTGMLANVGDSKLYSINVASGPSLVRIGAASSDQDAAPVAVLLPNGHWDEALNAGLTVVNDAGTIPVTIFDNGTAAGYNFSLTSKAEALTSAAENDTANDTRANAPVAAGLPFMLTGGTVGTTTDKDYIKITLTAAAKVTVVTSSSDELTDTQVDIQDNSGTSVVSGPVDAGGCFPLFGEPCGENVESDMLAAGTYFVEITPGAAYATSQTHKAYTALVFLN
jgi:hypothetical protein